MSRRQNPVAKAIRRGSTYALVMFSSLIVATLGLGALQAMRVQGHQFRESNQFAQARLYARAATEIAMLRVKYNPYWRTQFGNGAWFTSQTIGSGTYSLSAVDPIDGDVTVGNNDPIILTATGTSGSASYTTSVRMEVGPPPGSPLEVSMTSASDTVVTSAILTSNQTVSAGGNFNSQSSSTINANVEAAGTIQGSGYSKATATVATARPMPDPVHVFDYYNSNGTTINYSSLTSFTQTEMTTNPKFETNIANWYASGSCTLQQSTAKAKEGTHSLLVSARGQTTAVAAQDLVPASLALLQSGHSYQLTIPIYIQANCSASVVLNVTDTIGGTTQYVSTPQNLTLNILGQASWSSLQGTFTPTWTGTLTGATIQISVNSQTSYYMDAVSLIDVTFPTSGYVMQNVLLSPTSNPYGATNSQGIYLLACGNQRVYLWNSRVVGTLMISSAQTGSAIQGCVAMEPALPNYPSLLIDASSQITIAQGNTSASEVNAGTNFNPAGTPYPYLGGASNATLTDSYPAAINGLVYAGNNLTFSGAPTISGVVIGAGQILVNASSLNLSYANTCLMNPPPGFTGGTAVLKTVPGTRTRITN